MDMTDKQCSSINNRFKLVILASQRAHDLSSGAHATIEDKESKNTVIALKEIAGNKLNNRALFDFAVKRCRSYIDDLFAINNDNLFSRNAAVANTSYSEDFVDLNQDSASDDYEADAFDDSEVNDSEVNDSEVNDSELNDSEVNDSDFDVDCDESQI